MNFLLNFMNVASIKSKENCQNIVTWGLKYSLLLLNKAQKSMRGLFSGVPPILSQFYHKYPPSLVTNSQRKTTSIEQSFVFERDYPPVTSIVEGFSVVRS